MRNPAPTPVDAARSYFALQAVGGTVWWVAVFTVDDVRRWTLGGWDPGWLVGPDLLLFVGGSAIGAVVGDRRVAVLTAAWTVAVTVTLATYGLYERVAGWGVVLMTLASVATLAAAATSWAGRLPTGWFFIGPFSFRVAGERTRTQHLRRSLAQLLVFWTGFFVAVPLALSWAERRLRLGWPTLDRPGLRIVAITSFTVASALGLWSCVTMALDGEGTPLPAQTARRLVVVGPYRYVRNPMAVAGAVQTASVGLWLGSWTVVAIALAGAVGWDLVIRPVEEADLAARLSADYDRYRDAVRCWIPTWR